MAITYRTTDDAALVRHKEECIDCASETLRKATSEEEAFVCFECDLVVIDVGHGKYKVVGEVNRNTKNAYSLKKI